MEEGTKLLELLVKFNIMDSKVKLEEQLKITVLKMDDILVSDENKIVNISDFKNGNIKISFMVKTLYFQNYLGFFNAF